jgi:hypothetical protein
MKVIQQSLVRTFFLILAFSTSLQAFRNGRRAKGRRSPSLLLRPRQHHGATKNSKNDDYDSSSIHDHVLKDKPIIALHADLPLRLPLFPLRKRVRFPTDQLTLNLYEDRYLQMSEYILFRQNNQEQRTPQSASSSSSNSIPFPLFGVIYSSDKAQLIAKGGSSPIVPMLDPGDVGVICVVQDWIDGMVPTGMMSSSSSSSLSATPSLRRRMRLNALAIGRFSIERIVQDGTGCSLSAKAKDDDDDESELDGILPFILADTKVLIDDHSVTGLNQDLIDAVEDELQKRFNNADGRSFFMDSNSSDEAGDTTRTPAGTEMSSMESLSLPEIVDLVVSIVHYGDDDDSSKNDSTAIRKSQQRNEFFSFAATSALSKITPKLSGPGTMSNLLKLQSTEQRLRRLLMR